MSRPAEAGCTACGVRGTSPFCSLTGRSRRQFERERTVHTYERGQVVFYEGEPPLAMHCIRSGRVKIFKRSGRGDDLVIRILGPGEILGYRAPLADEPYAASAGTLEETTVCTLSRRALLGLVARSPDFALAFLKKLALELRVSDEIALEIFEQPVPRRAARLLLMLVEDAASKARRSASVRIQRKDLAAMIATTPETLSRVLRGFAQRGLVELTRTEIRVRDPATLRRVAGSRST